MVRVLDMVPEKYLEKIQKKSNFADWAISQHDIGGGTSKSRSNQNHHSQLESVILSLKSRSMTTQAETTGTSSSLPPRVRESQTAPFLAGMNSS